MELVAAVHDAVAAVRALLATVGEGGRRRTDHQKREQEPKHGRVRLHGGEVSPGARAPVNHALLGGESLTVDAGPPYRDGMKVGVVGDTHLPRFGRQLPSALSRGLREERVELIVHVGDFTGPDVPALFEALAPLEAVAGNNDPAALATRLAGARSSTWPARGSAWFTVTARAGRRSAAAAPRSRTTRSMSSASATATNRSVSAGNPCGW